MPGDNGVRISSNSRQTTELMVGKSTSRPFAMKTREMALELSFEFYGGIKIPSLKFRNRGRNTLPRWPSSQSHSRAIQTRMFNNFMKRLWISGLVSTRLFLTKWLLPPFLPLISLEFVPRFPQRLILGPRQLFQNGYCACCACM
jgi:hypothetical protein